MGAEPIIIGDVEKFSIVDFPEHIAAVVFMQGCVWRCPFCYNTSLQQLGAKPESNWTFEKLMALLERRKGIIDAVVFSGGEPLAQDGLSEAIDEVKALGYKIGLHTGGYRPEMLQKIIGKLDWAGLDIKAPLIAERYMRATGGYKQVENIRQSLQILLASGKHFECRTTCDPRILQIEDIYAIADELKSAGVKEYYLQKYRPISTDKITTDEMCSALIENKNLTAYLEQIFDIFAVRK